MFWIFIVSVSVLIITGYSINYIDKLKYSVFHSNEVLEQVKDDVKSRINEIVFLREEKNNVDLLLAREKSRNKSVEVRTGQIMEKMTPFLEVFKHDPSRAVFIGQPIDYIVFGEDEIVFVEVKTGKSKTSKKQNNIKKLIEDKKVRFELVRFEYEQS